MAIPIDSKKQQTLQDVEAERSIVRLTLRDIGQFGPEPVSFNFSQATLITGDNFLGKTTILKVILGLLDDHNPDLIRLGCDEGHVVAEYSDGLRVEQTITHGGSELKITLGDGRRVTKSPKTFLSKMATGFALDPMRLVNEKDKQKRKEFLQKLLPLSFTKDEMDAICGVTRLSGEIGLDQFDQFVEAIRESRRDQKRIVDSHTSILAEHERTLAPKEETDWGKAFDAANGAKTGLEKQRDSRIAALDLSAEKQRKAATDVRTDKVREIEALRDQQIREIEAWCKAAIDEVVVAENDSITAISADTQAEKDRLETTFRPQIDAAITEVATAKTKYEHQQQLAGIHQLITQTRRQIETEGSKWSILNDRVKQLEELRNKKLAEMPIKGVEIRGTKIFCDGLDFDTQLSGAEQILCAANICALATGGLPLMVFDEIEKLGVVLEDLIAGAKKKGIQVIMTRVILGQKVLQVEAA